MCIRDSPLTECIKHSPPIKTISSSSSSSSSSITITSSAWWSLGTLMGVHTSGVCLTQTPRADSFWNGHQNEQYPNIGNITTLPLLYPRHRFCFTGPSATNAQITVYVKITPAMNTCIVPLKSLMNLTAAGVLGEPVQVKN